MSFPSFLSMYQQLIAAPSISSIEDSLCMSNKEVITLLATWCESLGFTCEITELENGKGRYNLLAKRGEGDGGLMLAGHTDTVPFDDSRWNYNPFQLSEHDNKLYGLGSIDMKGFFAFVLQAISELDESKQTEPLLILATADEETTMAGARALVKQGRPKARYAVIGEPTGMTPITMHKGMMMEAIRIQGHSGHSSDPSLGVNALEAMHVAIGTILDWRKELQTKYHNPRFAIPVPTINLGCIHGGDNPNRICGACELQIDVRPLPGLSIEELRMEITTKLKPIEAQFPGISPTMEPIYPGLPPFELSNDSKIVKLAEQLTGQQAESVSFGTEAPYFQQLGMDPIILGPGGISEAHQPNEFLALKTLQPMIDVVKGLVTRLCLK